MRQKPFSEISSWVRTDVSRALKNGSSQMMVSTSMNRNSRLSPRSWRRWAAAACLRALASTGDEDWVMFAMSLNTPARS